MGILSFSCGDQSDSVSASRKLVLIDSLNSSLAHCSRLADIDSISACALAKCDELLAHVPLPADDRHIWEKYARINALAEHHRELAITLIDQVLPETEDYRYIFERAQFLNLRSYINYLMLNRQLSVYDAYQAADIYMELGLANAAAVCYLKITNVQYNAGNHEVAIENAFHAVRLYGKTEHLNRRDTLHWINASNTLGMSYANLENYSAAARQYQNGLNLAAGLNHELWAAIITGNLAQVDAANGHYDDAWKKYDESIRVGLRYKELASAGMAVQGQAEILTKRGRLDLAKQYYDSAWKLMRRERRPELWMIHFKRLSAWYEAVKDYDAANVSYKRYIALRDSTQGMQSSQLLRLQNQIQFDKQLSLLRAENDLKKKDLKTSYLVIISFVAILVLLSLLLYSLRKNYTNINKLNDELERTVKKRTKELLRLNKELDTYLYRASHDVRRPILSIIGLGYLAGMAGDNVAERKEIQEKIDLTAREMDKMLSKIRMAYELDKLTDAQGVNVNMYLASVVEGFRKSNPGVTFTLSASGVACVHTPPGLLEMIFVNILENACTFRNTHNPTVTIRSVVTAHKQVMISFSDNGIGIDREYIETIFKPYTRYSDLSAGSGLGLFLAKKAIRKLHGTIRAESTRNAGATFTVSLPLHTTVDPDRQQSVQPQGQASSRVTLT